MGNLTITLLTGNDLLSRYVNIAIIFSEARLPSDVFISQSMMPRLLEAG
jgi:hypothetical protein